MVDNADAGCLLKNGSLVSQNAGIFAFCKKLGGIRPSLALTKLPDALRRKLPRDGQVPAVQLDRLAVSSETHGRGLGALLLADAPLRTDRRELAWAVFLVRANHQRAAAFYRHFAFTPLHGDPLLLWITRQQVRKLSELH